jgi:hypothetical protein
MNLFFTDSIEYDNVEVRDFGAGVVFMLFKQLKCVGWV